MNHLHVTGPSSATDIPENDGAGAHVHHGDSKRNLHAGVPPMFEDAGSAAGQAGADAGRQSVGIAHE